MQQMQITKPITYMVGGREVSADTLISSNPRKTAPKREGPDEYHKGWSVEGYPPGMIAEAERIARDRLARWSAMTDEQRRKAESQGDRAPKPWDLNQWLIATKPKKVRSKPYEIPEAAQECGRLAVKAGWEHVRVTELKKAKA